MPDWKAYLRGRLNAHGLPPARAEEILEELAQHLAQRYEEAIAGGASDNQAFAAAVGDLPPVRELAQAITSADAARPAAPPGPQGNGVAAVVAAFVQDARYAARILTRTPAFTLVAIATLALGIGGTTAVFSVTHAVLLRPLPYPEPDRLVQVGEDSKGQASTAGYATYLDWRDQSQAFDNLAAVGSWSPTLVTADGPARLHGMRVTHGFFRVLGVQPALGRLFTDADDRPGAPRRVALLSDRLWRDRFGADPDVVERPVRINGVDYRVIGVMPARFQPLISGHFYEPAEIWSPLGYDASLPYACRSCQHLRVFGRLRPGVTPAVARAELDAIQRNLVAEYPKEYAGRAMAVVRVDDELVREIRPTLRILMGAILFVLAIAVANLTSLLLARAAARQREIALRSVLGAERRRIVRQLLTEGVLLAVVGGAAGVAVALWATPLLITLAPADLPRGDSVGIDRVALAFAAGVTLLCGILVGLAPALRLSRPNLSDAIKAGDRAIVKGTGRRVRSVLVAVEVALAVVLLTGAGLMLRTMATLLRVEPGFDPTGVLTLHVSVVGSEFEEDAQVLRFQRDVLERIRVLPGIEAAALASQVPFGGNFDRYGLDIEGRPALGPEERPALERYAVTPGYFDALRIPLGRGRLLTERDTPVSEPVILVNETAARRIWPDTDAIGQRIRLGGPDAPFRRIVGIVGDVRHSDLSAAAPMQMYLPQTQMTDAFLTIVARTSVDPATVTSAIRRQVSAVAPAVPVYDVAVLQDLIAKSMAQQRFLMRLLAALAGLALILAAIGVYGVLAWWVIQRLPEMAIRMAVGARPVQIVGLVLARGAAVVAAGTIAGVAAALALTRYLESQLYGVSANDPVTFGAIIAIVLAAALVANLLPARRAARVDPLVLLREN